MSSPRKSSDKVHKDAVEERMPRRSSTVGYALDGGALPPLSASAFEYMRRAQEAMAEGSINGALPLCISYSTQESSSCLPSPTQESPVFNLGRLLQERAERIRLEGKLNGNRIRGQNGIHLPSPIQSSSGRVRQCYLDLRSPVSSPYLPFPRSALDLRSPIPLSRRSRSAPIDNLSLLSPRTRARSSSPRRSALRLLSPAVLTPNSAQSSLHLVSPAPAPIDCHDRLDELKSPHSRYSENCRQSLVLKSPNDHCAGHVEPIDESAEYVIVSRRDSVELHLHSPLEVATSSHGIAISPATVRNDAVFPPNSTERAPLIAVDGLVLPDVETAAVSSPELPSLGLSARKTHTCGPSSPSSPRNSLRRPQTRSSEQSQGTVDRNHGTAFDLIGRDDTNSSLGIVYRSPGQVSSSLTRTAQACGGTPGTPFRLPLEGDLDVDTESAPLAVIPDLHSATRVEEMFSTRPLNNAQPQTVVRGNEVVDVATRLGFSSADENYRRSTEGLRTPEHMHTPVPRRSTKVVTPVSLAQRQNGRVDLPSFDRRSTMNPSVRTDQHAFGSWDSLSTRSGYRRSIDVAFHHSPNAASPRSIAVVDLAASPRRDSSSQFPHSRASREEVSASSQTLLRELVEGSPRRSDLERASAVGFVNERTLHGASIAIQTPPHLAGSRENRSSGMGRSAWLSPDTQQNHGIVSRLPPPPLPARESVHNLPPRSPLQPGSSHHRASSNAASTYGDVSHRSARTSLRDEVGRFARHSGMLRNGSTRSSRHVTPNPVAQDLIPSRFSPNNRHGSSYHARSTETSEAVPPLRGSGDAKDSNGGLLRTPRSGISSPSISHFTPLEIQVPLSPARLPSEFGGRQLGNNRAPNGSPISPRRLVDNTNLKALLIRTSEPQIEDGIALSRLTSGHSQDHSAQASLPHITPTRMKQTSTVRESSRSTRSKASADGARHTSRTGDILPIPHFSGKGAVSTQVIAADSSFSSDSSSNYEEDDYALPRLSIDEWHDAAPQKTRSTSRSATKISKTNVSLSREKRGSGSSDFEEEEEESQFDGSADSVPPNKRFKAVAVDVSDGQDHETEDGTLDETPCVFDRLPPAPSWYKNTGLLAALIKRNLQLLNDSGMASFAEFRDAAERAAMQVMSPTGDQVTENEDLVASIYENSSKQVYFLCQRYLKDPTNPFEYFAMIQKLFPFPNLLPRLISMV